MTEIANGVRVEWVRIPMRDGVEIAARVFTPVDAPGPFPAVLCVDPYRSAATSRLDPGEESPTTSADGPAFLARNGYVAIFANARGTGNSSGASTSLYSDDDRADAVELIEWAAAQDWSTGDVGMWGMSYQGIVTWQAAADAPPALKAVVVAGATDDVFGDWARPGGAPRALFVVGMYAAMMTSLNALPPEAEVVGDGWRAMWEERLAGLEPWSRDLLEHPELDEYWRARTVVTDLGRIRCAVLSISGWHDWYPTSSLRAARALTVPRKIVVGDWAHVWPEIGEPGGPFSGLDLALRWFDRFLRDEDGAFGGEPSVSVRFRHPDGAVWWHGDTWPPEGGSCFEWHAGRSGSLGPDREAESSVLALDPDPSVGVAVGLFGAAPSGDQAEDDARSLCATTAPLESAVVVAGRPVVVVAGTSSTPGYLHARICDVAPDGSSTLVCSGGRALAPGEFEVEIELAEAGYAVPAGHRIRLALSTSDFPNVWPAPTEAIAVRVGGEHGVRLLVPVSDVPVTPDPRPAAPDGADEPPPPAPFYVVERDGGRTVVSQTSESGYPPNRRYAPDASSIRFSVSHEVRGEAELVATATRRLATPDGDADIRVTTVTRSDAESFDSVVELDVRLAGSVVAERSWRTVVPR